jgi:hypothetical protein
MQQPQLYTHRPATGGGGGLKRFCLPETGNTQKRKLYRPPPQALTNRKRSVKIHEKITYDVKDTLYMSLAELNSINNTTTRRRRRGATAKHARFVPASTRDCAFSPLSKHTHKKKTLSVDRYPEFTSKLRHNTGGYIQPHAPLTTRQRPSTSTPPLPAGPPQFCLPRRTLSDHSAGRS